MSVFHAGITIVPLEQVGPPTTGTWDRGTLIIDANGDLYKCATSGTPGTWTALITSIPPPDLVASFPEFIDTFVNGLQTGMGWSIQALSGTYAQSAPPASKGGRNGVVGVINVTTGTSTTGRVGAILGASLLRFESGNTYTLWCRFLGGTPLADATNDYSLRIGFIDSNLAAESVDGAYFEYLRASSPNWRCKTASNSSRTTVTTTVPVQDTDWIDLKIRVNGTTGVAEFFINDVLVATINSNVPTAAGRETSVGFSLAKTAGGTSRGVFFDRFYLKLEAA